MLHWLPALVLLLMQGPGQEVHALGLTESRHPLVAQYMRLRDAHSQTLTPTELALLVLLAEESARPQPLAKAPQVIDEPRAVAWPAQPQKAFAGCYSCQAKLRDGPRSA